MRKYSNDIQRGFYFNNIFFSSLSFIFSADFQPFLSGQDLSQSTELDCPIIAFAGSKVKKASEGQREKHERAKWRGKKPQTYSYSFYFTFNHRKGKKEAHGSSCFDEKSTGKKRSCSLLNTSEGELLTAATETCLYSLCLGGARGVLTLAAQHWRDWSCQGLWESSALWSGSATKVYLCFQRIKKKNPERRSIWDICLVYGTFTAREEATSAWALNLQSFTGSGEGVRGAGEIQAI